MPLQKNLYFIALIPNNELKDRIKELKEEMKERFNSKHALNSPAHITLQMPYRRSENEENNMIQFLEDFAKHQKPFHVDLKGFGCFTPRVLFVKVYCHAPIIQLHMTLKEVLKNQLDFKEKDITTNIHPHMTTATRDLSKLEFHKAWPEFENRVFEASFEAKSLFLLKHNGKFWDINREFLFGKTSV